MINRINNPIIDQISPTGVAGTRKNSASKSDFASILAQETKESDGLKISAHAQRRLDSSNVRLGQDDMKRIDTAIAKAAEKGSNQALIMLDDLALVISIKNRVLITAIDKVRNREGVFTNIDSVVIA